MLRNEDRYVSETFDESRQLRLIVSPLNFFIWGVIFLRVITVPKIDRDSRILGVMRLCVHTLSRIYVGVVSECVCTCVHVRICAPFFA